MWQRQTECFCLLRIHHRDRTCQILHKLQCSEHGHTLCVYPPTHTPYCTDARVLCFVHSFFSEKYLQTELTANCRPPHTLPCFFNVSAFSVFKSSRKLAARTERTRWKCVYRCFQGKKKKMTIQSQFFSYSSGGIPTFEG